MSYLLNVQKDGVFLLLGPEEAGVLGLLTPAKSREVRAGTTVLSLWVSTEVMSGSGVLRSPRDTEPCPLN